MFAIHPSPGAHSRAIGQTIPMAMRLFLFGIGVLVVTMVAACQQPSSSDTPAGSAAPGGGASPAGGATPGGASPGGGATPVAPAVEQSHPDAERTIPLPTSAAPVAPDIEMELRPDPTVPTEPE